MKKDGIRFAFYLVGLLLVMVALILMSGCSYNEKREAREKSVENALSGERELRVLYENNNSGSRTSGFYLFGFGSLKSSSGGPKTITFSWKHNDGSYVVSRVPWLNTRVRFVQGLETPTVSFHWDKDWAGSHGFDENNVQESISKVVPYITITCSPEQWPRSINLPTGK